MTDYEARNSGAASCPRPWPRFGRNGWGLCLTLLVLVTLMFRARYFGNPTIDVDEEFYLLTGDRMLHGAVPYVDIWDRKPVGLFLLFAAIRLLGGDGIVQYQLVAAAFVAATALMIAMVARSVSTPSAAVVAALTYAPALATSGGQGGQSPVFYNLFVVAAAWLLVRLLIRSLDRPATARVGSGATAPSMSLLASRASEGGAASLRWQGAAAMLLIGAAMQVKYTAVFEGVYFGLFLVWLDKRSGSGALRLAADIGLWITCALLPTALAFAWFASKNHAGVFIYANFLSIFRRTSILHPWSNLRHVVVRLTPFLISIIIFAVRSKTLNAWRSHPMQSPLYQFLAGWLTAAAAGFLLFGGYFNHYALPLFPPLAIVVAPAFDLRPRPAGKALMVLTLVPFLIAFPFDARKYEQRNGDPGLAYRLAAFIGPRLQGGCLYVFYGEPILYHLTGSCIPTRYAFPFHLALSREAPALGINPVAETERIMATRPSVVVDRTSSDAEVNTATQASVRSALAGHYRLILSVPHGGTRPAIDRVYLRRARAATVDDVPG